MPPFLLLRMGDKIQQQVEGRKRLLVQQQRPLIGFLLGSRSNGGEWYPHTKTDARKMENRVLIQNFLEAPSYPIPYPFP